jgi:putative tricarboxylic transport membrane protein
VKSSSLLSALVIPITLLSLVAAIVGAGVAAAEWQPDKNVEIIVGTGPGGGQDKTARTLQRILQERQLLKVPATVVNKPGGGGTVGWTYINQHAGDGHYIEIGNTTLLTNHLIGRSTVSYTDLTPIAMLLAESVALSVRADSPIKSGKDLLERLKKDSGAVSVSVGSSLGGVNHIAAALVARAAGGDPKRMKTVVFQGGGEAMTALLGGHIDLVSSAANNVLPHLAAGRLRVLAITAPQRLGGVLASVPTWKELGVDAVATNWRMIAGAKNLSPAQVAYWEEALGRLAEAPEWKKDLETNDFEPLFMKGEALKRYLREQNDAFRTALTALDLVK